MWKIKAGRFLIGSNWTQTNSLPMPNAPVAIVGLQSRIGESPDVGWLNPYSEPRRGVSCWSPIALAATDGSLPISRLALRLSGTRGLLPVCW